MRTGAPPPRRTDRTGERGAILFLFPVGFLIVVLLGAVAVDLGNVWLQQRRLADAVDSAVNDAVAGGIDQDRYRADGVVVLDPDRVAIIIAASLAGQGLPPEAVAEVPIIGTAPNGLPMVTLRLRSRVPSIFGRVLADAGQEITAVGTAIATVG